MTLHQKILLYLIMILATAIFMWPVGVLMTTFFFDVGGHIPIKYPDSDDPE